MPGGEEQEEETVGAEAILIPLNYENRTYRERIKDIYADRDKINKATEALNALGFTIPATDGIVSISIFGKRRLFEEVFQIKLNTVTAKDIDNRENTLSSRSPYYYVSNRNVKIPKALEGLVYDIVFSTEPTFM